MNVTFNVTM